MTEDIIIVHRLSSEFVVGGSVLGINLRGANPILEGGDSFGILRGVDGGGEDLPDAVDPVQVLWLHEDGAKASDRFAVAANSWRQGAEETDGKVRDGEVETAVGSGGEDGAGFG